MKATAITRDKVIPLAETWPRVGEILGTKGFDTIAFVEAAFMELRLRLFSDRGGDGLWRPEKDPGPLLSDLGVSDFAHAFANKCSFSNEGYWLRYRITHKDFDKLTAFAEKVIRTIPGEPEYPAELRAAIDAYEAVSSDPNATKRQGAKAALLAWLKKNKPELTSNARERIATVANWQPRGGAPKTLG